MATLNPSQLSVSAGSGWRGNLSSVSSPSSFSAQESLTLQLQELQSCFPPTHPLSCHLIHILAGKPWQPSRGLTLSCGFFSSSFSICRILVTQSALMNLHRVQNFDYLWVFRVSSTLWEKIVNCGLCCCSLHLISSVLGLVGFLVFLYF